MRRHLIVRGLVQGVGCRPWIWQQATELGLSGWVRNTPLGVEVLVSGQTSPLDALCERLWRMPAPARVQQLDQRDEPDMADLPPLAASGFEILHSTPTAGAQPVDALMGADLAVCEACLSELFDPGKRRWRHPFIHCPQCGPRYTVMHQLPFDRAQTSLAPFALCPACDDEVHAPGSRRFHDQTNACPACGPRLSLCLSDGQAVAGDAIAGTLRLLQQGRIVAIKGVGGFHLCCDARQPEAVQRLRARKRRESKPLAVMAANVASLSAWADVSADEARWLSRPERPIVLLPQNDAAQAALPALAPHLAWLGAMLPYAPVHHLLFHEAMGRPQGTHWLSQPQALLLVMTSGNAPGEPLVTDNEAAWRELAPLADALLLHDREITARNDDSVLRVRADGSACWLRRGRGWAPLPVSWPALASPTILALGGELKATLCLSVGTRQGGTHAFVSPHVGDLNSAGTRAAFHALQQRWLAQRQRQPEALACDAHPDSYSSRLAAELATPAGLPLIAVQHHHAHIAAVLAEHAEDPASLEPVIGLALDGHGLGDDGQAWGGELLHVHRDQCLRLGHLQTLALPGGERAAREPWRLGAALLHELGRNAEITQRFADQPAAAMLSAWLAQAAPNRPADQANPIPRTSSLGRLFDAAAGVLRLLTHSQHEGDAAMRLESLAAQAWPAQALPLTHSLEMPQPSGQWAPLGQPTAPSVLGWHPLMNWLCDQAHTDPAQVAQAAAVFHATLARDLAQWAIQACHAHGVGTVVLNGGCLANRLLDEALTQQLQSAGLRVWRASQYPCGDGGLSLGQAWVAHHRLARPPSR